MTPPPMKRSWTEILGWRSPRPSRAPRGRPEPAGPRRQAPVPARAPGSPGIIDPLTLPPTAGGPLPAALRPAIGMAKSDHPAALQRRLPFRRRTTLFNGPCVYGDPERERRRWSSSATATVSPGSRRSSDWRPSVAGGSINLTKGACSTADIVQFNSQLKRVYTECPEWRENMFERVESEHPDLVIVANSRNVEHHRHDGHHAHGATDATRRRGAPGIADSFARFTADRGPRRRTSATSPARSSTCPSASPDSMTDTLACTTPFERGR